MSESLSIPSNYVIARTPSATVREFLTARKNISRTAVFRVARDAGRVDRVVWRLLQAVT
jgi:hypothetical protein